MNDQKDLFWHLQSIPGLPGHFGRRETDRAKASHCPDLPHPGPWIAQDSKDGAETCKLQENQSPESSQH